MSFILEALKKSENKRRRKSIHQQSRSIHEPVPQNNAKSRIWILAIVIVLLVNVVFLFWYFSPWKQSSLTTESTIVADSKQLQADIEEAVVSQVDSSVSPAVVTDQQSQESTEQSGAKALRILRSEKNVYSFGQLPAPIQKQIPPLHMSLHAYNRDDATASMVQLNDRIMREKEMITANISLEQITSDGVVLRYDGYRFLVPRRGN